MSASPRPTSTCRTTCAAASTHPPDRAEHAGRPTLARVADMDAYRPGRAHTSRAYPVIPPIYQSTTFELDDQAYKDIQTTGGLHETWYSRFGNPTVDAAGAEVARLHGAARALMTASGMAAVATTLVSLLRSGDTLVASKQVY